jgi:Lrp/AsnC family transcriptional regulator for asnA, asnC and gidA
LANRKKSRQSPTTLDKLDYALIDEFQVNGRTSFTNLGAKFRVSHGTIRNRLDRLLSNRIINVLGVVDPTQVGFPIQVYIGISADVGHLKSIEAQLARFDEVNFVAMTTGRIDFLIGAALASDAALRDFLVRKLARVKGVRSTETFHVLHLAKRPWQWRLPHRQHAVRRGRRQTNTQDL